MVSPSPELQTFTMNLEDFVLQLKYNVHKAIDFCISRSVIDRSEVDFCHALGIGPDKQVRMFLEILETKIEGNPGFFRTFLDYLKSCPVHEEFGKKIGIYN